MRPRRLSYVRFLRSYRFSDVGSTRFLNHAFIKAWQKPPSPTCRVCFLPSSQALAWLMLHHLVLCPLFSRLPQPWIWCLVLAK